MKKQYFVYLAVLIIVIGWFVYSRVLDKTEIQLSDGYAFSGNEGDRGPRHRAPDPDWPGEKGENDPGTPVGLPIVQIIGGVVSFSNDHPKPSIDVISPEPVYFGKELTITGNLRDMSDSYYKNKIEIRNTKTGKKIEFNDLKPTIMRADRHQVTITLNSYDDLASRLPDFIDPDGKYTIEISAWYKRKGLVNRLVTWSGYLYKVSRRVPITILPDTPAQ